MSDVVIGFDRISKKYRLRRGWYFSIRDEAASLARRLLGRADGSGGDFWALRDVSFDVGRGETVGLVGANGAGKSTILKILSRVTTPTTGDMRVAGKVGALIEVGAGFHPELTGRENVFLNGSILGMRRAEIEAKFERIAAFAEIDRFLDTPIKYYSSGMIVRLGFAVAAHIEPEILLVDEVLAVGDAAFQAKCLNKLAELRAQQKTIILVSHVLPNILQHASRVLWIDHGRVQAFGSAEPVVEDYLRSVQKVGTWQCAAIEGAPMRISGVVVRDWRGAICEVLEYGRGASIDVSYEVAAPVEDPVVGITFHDVRGHPLGGLTSRLDGLKVDTMNGGGLVRLQLRPVIFTRGAYSVSVTLHDSGMQRYLDVRSGAATFTVDGPSVASREVSGHAVYPHTWERESNADGERPSRLASAEGGRQ